MARMPRSLTRGLAVSLATLVLATLLLEGATSLFTGTPLSARLLRVDAVVPAAPTLAEGARLTAGPFARDRDPAVGYRLKSGFRPVFAGVESTTDAYGQRVRPGAPPEPGALRVVLLGDSVAYGFGVRDHEAPGHRLEEHLRAAAAPGAPAVWTAACPGWSWESSFRYLRNHLARLDPDVVLYVAVANDLDDPTVINEVGWRSMDFDPGPDRPQASCESHLRLRRTLERHPPRAAIAEVVLAGGPRVIENVLYTGVTPESDRRWRAYAAGLDTLARELADRGTRFAVVLDFDREFQRQAEVRLAHGAPDVPLWGLMAGYTHEDSLPNDGHYNAPVVDELARRTARHLITAGWLPGADAERLPAPAPELGGRPYVPLGPSEREGTLRTYHEEILAFVRDSIDLDLVLGVHQVYGGLYGDGTVGKHVTAALSRPGAARIELEIERLPADAGVYPLELTVAVPDQVAGVVAVPPPVGEDARIVLFVPVPDELREEGVLDVRVTASAWVEEPGPPSEPAPRLASFRLRRLALVGG
jgi:hypothetical protein